MFLFMTIRHIAEVRQGMALAGRGAGARSGDWPLRVVDSADIEGDRVSLEGLREVEVFHDSRSEAHLLRPFDILVTARSQRVKVALVPPEVTRTVAGPTLLVIRPFDTGAGLGHYLWWYLTSSVGRRQVEAQVTLSTLPSLSAKALGDVEVPVPPLVELRRLAGLIEASEGAHRLAIEAARIRHDVLRDSIIAEVAARSGAVESARKE